MSSDEFTGMLDNLGVHVLEKDGAKNVWMSLMANDAVTTGHSILHFVLGESDLEIWMPVMTEINTPSANLMTYLLAANSAILLGKFCLTPDGRDIILKVNYPLVGFCEQELADLLSIVSRIVRDHYRIIKNIISDDTGA